MTASASSPIEVSRANQHDVKIRWQDGHESVYPARELRLACPCAGCVDELTGAARLVAPTIPDDVHPLKIEPVGRYAMTVHWSDGHHTGIYSFDRLRNMCPCDSCSHRRQATSDQGTTESLGRGLAVERGNDRGRARSPQK